MGVIIPKLHFSLDFVTACSKKLINSLKVNVSLLFEAFEIVCSTISVVIVSFQAIPDS
jgi:hypothetical protein